MPKKLTPCKKCGSTNIGTSAILMDNCGYIGYARCQDCGEGCKTTYDSFGSYAFYGEETRYKALKKVTEIWNKLNTLNGEELKQLEGYKQ